MRESSIVKPIKDYLQFLENQGKLVYIRNNSGVRVSEYKGKRGFVKYGKAGSSDFLIFISEGRTLHIEAKQEKGKPNANQIAYRSKIEVLGHVYYIVRSFDELERILKGSEVI